MEFRDYPILYVDDEKSNRVVMKHTLAEDFTLLLAESGEQALEILKREPITVLLSDQRMPRMTGVDLAEQVHKLYPDIRRLLITAYSDLQATIDAINRGRVHGFIKKPWTAFELAAIIRESITSYHQAKITQQMQLHMIKFDQMANLGLAAMGVAHDLKQPLAIIVPSLDAAELVLQQLRETPNLSSETLELVADIIEAVADVRHGVQSLRQIAGTIMDVVGQRKLASKRLNVVEAVQSALVITRTMIMRVGQLEIWLPDTPIYSSGSSSRLAQLVVNLLINAAQSLGHERRKNNRIQLRVSSSDSQAMIQIEDNGPGIPGEIRDRIFSPLFTSGRKEGSGLGLAICKQVAEELSGTIGVESEPGLRTCFTVTLPLVDVES